MSGRPPAGAKPPIILESGDGAWVTDVEGNRYLDGLSGQWCVNVGYGRERLADAAAEQLKKLAFHPLTRGHVPAIELGERLDALLGGTARRSTPTPARRRTSSRSSWRASTSSCAASTSGSRSSRATAPTTARRSAR